MEILEKVILVGVQLSDGFDVNASLNELSELARTAGAEEAGRIIQNREAMHPGTYIGKGKIEEVKELLWETEATGIICDDELSPAQMKNLEDALDTKVMDRTVLILDIFASRATTAEGKIQVELAQSRYSLTRLAGYGTSMSRLGGGIGTRGPGETKLETDRRRIRDRISTLKRELLEVQKRRGVNRALREKNHAPVVAIVGYTNAGKSTLLNQLTDANILAEDKLFATLDPTTRSLKLPSGQTALFTDTVGFINKLPHHLVEAFKSTLEEAMYADVIAHVVDVSNPEEEKQMSVVYETLKGLGVTGKPIITVFNKCDRPEAAEGYFRDPRADRTVRISALTGEGIPELLQNVEELLLQSKVYIEKLYDFKDAGKIQPIRKYGQLLSEEYTDQGILIKAWVPKEYAGGRDEEEI